MMMKIERRPGWFLLICRKQAEQELPSLDEAACWHKVAPACWWQRGTFCDILIRDTSDTRHTLGSSRTQQCPRKGNPTKEHNESVLFVGHVLYVIHMSSYHTLIPYLCLMATLRDRAAGEIILSTHISHKGRQRFSPNLPETVQARHGPHQKP